MSNGYIPLFGSLTTGTLCGRWPDVGLWPIVLSLSDRHGRVDVTPMYLASVTGLPVAEVVACMKRFCGADPYSRTNTENGARLVLIDEHRDWGWRVVNHTKYREKARKHAYDADRTASGADADRKRAARSARTGPDESREIPLSDSDPDKTQTKAIRGAPEFTGAAFHGQVVDAYLRLCPQLPKIKTWPKHRREMLNARIRERCADGKPADTIEWWENFFEAVTASDFLSGRTEDPFLPGIDWLLGQKNFPKIVEENYINRKANGARAHG